MIMKHNFFDTDNVFEKVFENVKYIKKVFKYKYLRLSFPKVKYNTNTITLKKSI